MLILCIYNILHRHDHHHNILEILLNVVLLFAVRRNIVQVSDTKDESEEEKDSEPEVEPELQLVAMDANDSLLSDENIQNRIITLTYATDVIHEVITSPIHAVTFFTVNDVCSAYQLSSE